MTAKTLEKRSEEIPNDMVINGIIAFLGKGYEFITDRASIHNSFYKLAHHQKFKLLFNDMRFSKGGDYPRSEEIDNILGNMMVSRLISVKTPHLVNYEVHFLPKLYEKELKPYGNDNVNLIKKASEQFKKYIK